MPIEKKLSALGLLKKEVLRNTESLQKVIQQAEILNPWFTEAFIRLSLGNICNYYLDENELAKFAQQYKITPSSDKKTIGLIMAGNIPLVGFHDFLCCYLSPHRFIIKLSQKDNVLLKYIADVLVQHDTEAKDQFTYADMLKNCDAYIATGSSNSARYFEYYFGKYPNIIRRNRTSIAILDGTETTHDLALLAHDVFAYFGMGCRNVTKIYVPEQYDFVSLIQVFKTYDYLADYNKYKNNYDYNLAVAILNRQFYMSTASILLLENESIFSALAVLHYEFYTNKLTLENKLIANTDIQCIVASNHIKFGNAQQPTLDDFADGVNTIDWLNLL